MTARIFRPAPNAMQSGDGNSKRWVLVNEPASARQIEPLMGYTSSTDTETQVRLTFDTLELSLADSMRKGRRTRSALFDSILAVQTSANFTHLPSSALDLTEAVMNVMPSTPSSSVGNSPT